MESAALLQARTTPQIICYEGEPETSPSERAHGRHAVAGTVALLASGLVLSAILAVAPANRSSQAAARTEALRGLIEADESKCTWGQGNCNVTRCCNDPGSLCYEQDEFYAQCRESCNPGPIPTHWDEKPWSCKELGERSPGEVQCAGPGENCLESKCCKQAGTQCFKKHKDWATCKAECFPGAPDLMDIDSHPWSCEKLGPFTPGAQGWVWQKCAKAGENCATSKCCLDGDNQCYTQSGPIEAPYWAQCKNHCAPGEKANPWERGWDCKEVGSRTPAPPAKTGMLAKWAIEKCSDQNEDCSKSKCCHGVDAICYEKNSRWATCKTHCVKGKDPADNNETWSCKQLGPKGIGLTIKGTPSLYCFSLTRTSGYEVTIMQGQMNYSLGIFACDEYDVFSADGVMSLGKDARGDEIKTVKVEPAVIKTTMDGTAGNARLFVHVWDKVVELNKWRNHEWTIKADPDAVLIPERIRWHVAAHTGEKVYILNCNKFPSSPNFPMMFGSVEVFAFQAMLEYSRSHNACTDSMGQWLESWGEDYYMGKCMDLIKVGRISDYSIVGDAVCTGADCNNPGVASFHPFKDWSAWSECSQRAVNASKQR
mmetsp:Transcript_121515/g.349246  ORF Transcript_121515/g.349246 Transcript_121515/m.349246 type:complete len:597 (-) Transcript_121515:176-1966(-)